MSRHRQTDMNPTLSPLLLREDRMIVQIPSLTVLVDFSVIRQIVL